IVNTAFIILAFFTMRPSLLIALAMIVIGDLLTIVLTTRRLRHVGNPFKADLTFLRRIYRFGLVAMITTLLLTLNYRLDELMLKWMGISGELRGFYRTGVSLAGYGWIISDAFREVLFSRTAKNDAVDDVVFSLKINAYITIFMLAGIALLGKPVIHLLFGAAYLPAYQVTVVLLFGILSMSYFKLIGTLLLAQKKIKMYVATLTASVLMNVVANLLTIPTLGILGAALSSVLSYTLAGVVFLSYFMHTYHIKAKRIFLLNRGDFAFLSRKF
ncbi:MAG: polysaccharide biosynthesis C-terminal domain-containing protein, partial [Clostridia bacterium]